MVATQIITRQMSIEEELRKERDFTSAVVDTISSLIVVCDRDGRIVRFNRACEQLTGYSFEEVQSQPNFDFLVAPEERASLHALCQEMFAGRSPTSHENYWITKTGQRRLISWSNTALLDDSGEVEYIIGTGQDVTENRAYQEQLEKYAAAQTQLLQQMMQAQEAERHAISMEIHDGPLQSLGVSLLALDRAKLRYERGEVEVGLKELSYVRQTLVETVSEVRNILADLSHEVLSNYGLAVSLQHQAERFTEATGIEAELSVSLGQRLSANKELLLYRLAQEALANVRKHSGATKVLIRLAKQKDQVLLTISDDGGGFEVEEALKKHDDGKGIGLRSMYERIEAAGGGLTIETELGKGTTLKFRCPLNGKPKNDEQA